MSLITRIPYLVAGLQAQFWQVKDMAWSLRARQQHGPSQGFYSQLQVVNVSVDVKDMRRQCRVVLETPVFWSGRLRNLSIFSKTFVL